LAILRRKLPARRDVFSVFASCVFPIYGWSILWFLHKLPSWLQYLDFWDSVSIFAYTQAFALLESVVVLFVLVVLSIVLPVRFFRDKFAAQGSVMVFVAACLAVLLRAFDLGLRSWNFGELLLGLVLSLVPIGASCVLVHCSQRLEDAIGAFAERLTLMLYVYVPLGLLSLVFVVARNIFEVG
jgi:hypothetical protein